ncbi:methyltransferase domain-containing protein [Verrucomicrobiales bacterium BCK34]|nr:methyltransferase domain-containing protein [Verrucomicrobiales bacterium BCK34]
MNFINFKENSARRQIADFPLSKRASLIVGSILGSILRKRQAVIEKEPFANDANILNRLIRNGLYAKAFKQEDHVKLRNFFSHYWGKEAAAFHEGWNDRFERMFLKHDVSVIHDLEKLISERKADEPFRHLYEIGCGGGQVLTYLHDRFGNFTSLTGIDLGEEQIANNRKASTTQRTAFEAADANKWIPENAKSNSVILTNGGVFEYFLQSELEALFSFAAANLGPVAICLVETIATDHDLDKEPDSLVYGREMAFSHNYPQLLKAAGFSIVTCTERAGFSEDGGGRWIRVLAIKE